LVDPGPAVFINSLKKSLDYLNTTGYIRRSR